MGRSIYHRHVNDEVEEDGYHQGCMWGFIHALYYHHWNHNVKRILHHEKHEEKRRAKGKLNPKTSLKLQKNDEIQQLLEGNVRSLLLVNSNTKNKKSIKTRIKSFITQEVSEQESNKKQKKSVYSPRHRLHRTVSIHYLESSDHGLNKMRTNEDDGNILLNSPQIKVPNKDSRREVGNGDYSTGKFLHTLANSRTKARLTKSETFPKADLSRRMNLKPTKLEHKKNEIWFSPEGERLVDSAQEPELALPKYKMNFRARSWTLANDHGISITDRKSSPIPQKSKTELEKREQDEMVMAVEENKQRVETEVKQNVIMDGPSSGDYPSVSDKDPSRTSQDRAISRDYETDSSSFDELDEYSPSKMAVDYRRGSSFDDSLHRYARLLEYSTREQIILHSSKSLKVRNEYDLSFGTMRSLSHIGTVENSSFTDVNTRDEEIPVANPVNIDDKETLDASNETFNKIGERTDSLRKMESNIKNGDGTELLDHIEKVDDTDDKNTPPVEEDVNYTERNIETLSESILDSNSGATLLGGYIPTYSSEGSDEESDKYIDSEELADINSLSTSTPNLESCENGNENFKNLEKSEFYKKDDSDLNYVREILERSDLYRDVFNGTSRLVDPKEMECSTEDMYDDDSHHQFLYDLVIEVIIQIYDRSFTLYPKALSSICHVHPLPSENRFLDEVYVSISKLLTTNPNRYQTLDDYVSRDFAKDDGWVNFQSESECVALELEDIIFDELLEELLCP